MNSLKFKEITLGCYSQPGGLTAWTDGAARGLAMPTGASAKGGGERRQGHSGVRPGGDPPGWQRLVSPGTRGQRLATDDGHRSWQHREQHIHRGGRKERRRGQHVDSVVDKVGPGMGGADPAPSGLRQHSSREMRPWSPGVKAEEGVERSRERGGKGMKGGATATARPPAARAMANEVRWGRGRRRCLGCPRVAWEVAPELPGRGDTGVSISVLCDGRIEAPVARVS
jgi:hypothetical protein